jgi:outer membrane protein TolC
VAPATAQSSLPSKKLGLDEAVRLALAAPSAYRQALLDEQIAGREVTQARAGLLPRFDYLSGVSLASPRVGDPGVPAFISADATHVLLGAATATGTLDLAGGQRAAVRRAEALRAAARAFAEIQAKGVTLAVRDAYFALALAEATVAVDEQSVRDAADFEHVTGILGKEGEAARVDVMRAELQRSRREQELSRATGARIEASNDLAVLTGMPFDTLLETEAAYSTEPAELDLGQYAEALVKNRPELAYFEANRRAFEQEARQARADRFPRVEYGVSLGFENTNLAWRNRGATGFVSVTVPLFDWGAAKAREEQANFRAEASDFARDQAMRQLVGQFHSALESARLARARAGVAAADRTKAADALSIVRLRYQGGEGSIIEVLDAQDTKAMAEQAYYQALADYRRALARLDDAAGR